jgi:23S rRNA (pseudouridine1915-N3)-methyltransferase
MKWQIITVGKPALRFAQLASEDYIKRLRRHARVELRHLKALPEPHMTTRLHEAAGIDSLRMVLDERGTTDMNTMDLAQWLEAVELAGRHGKISVLIGGADGHSEKTRNSADILLSLSPFTLQHELALVLFLEQLYRIYTIKAGLPYHRQ